MVEGEGNTMNPQWWLDADFDGGRGRRTRARTLKTAIRDAEKMLEKVDEGQVGIFTAYLTGDHLGYVIKTPETGVYFERAE
jgi:hypothetical protein